MRVILAALLAALVGCSTASRSTTVEATDCAGLRVEVTRTTSDVKGPGG